MKKVLISLGILGGVLWSGVSLSNGLQVSPTSIKMTTTQPAAELWLSKTTQIKNPSPMHAQIRLFKWTQSDGKEFLKPTDEILASPPFIAISGDKPQLVRIIDNLVQNKILDKESLKDQNTPERAYRIIIDELPDMELEPKAGLDFVMHYSVPVFIGNSGSSVDESFNLSDLHFSWSQEKGKVFLNVKNDGNVHVQLVDVIGYVKDQQLKVLTKGLMGYVLPHSQMHWFLPISLEDSQKTEKIQLKINGHEESIQIQKEEH